MEKNYKEKRSSFAERLKTEPTPINIQKVEPVTIIEQAKEEPKVEEIQINAWIPKVLMKKVKTKAIAEDKSIKEVVIEALQQYIEN
jgi:hypothetical protein